MAAIVERPEDTLPTFRSLAALRDRLSSAAGRPLPDLSMGMSGDFEPAISAGATIIRVGSALYTGL